MKIKRASTTVLMLLMFFTAASACNQKDKDKKPAEIHLQVGFSSTNSPEDKEFYIKAIERFHKINPLITVKIDYAPEIESGEITSKLDRIELLKSDAPPDIVELTDYDLHAVEKDGLLQDLLQLQRLSTTDIDINQKILDAATLNGKLLLLPYMASPKVVVYNKAIFEAAQIPYPQVEWTWEEFRLISKKLQPTGGSILTYNYDTLEMLMGSKGMGLVSTNGDTAVGYLDSPEAVQAIQWLNAYYRDDKAKTEPMDLMDGIEFGHFQTGMMVTQFGSAYWNEADADKVDLAPLPHFEGGSRVNPTGIIGFGISQKSKQPEAAWKFIEYLALNKNEDSLKLVAGGLTTSKAIADATGQSNDPLKKVATDEMNYAVTSSMKNTPYFALAWNEALSAEFNKLLTTPDKEIPDKLHKLALKINLEMQRLKDAEVHLTESGAS